MSNPLRTVVDVLGALLTKLPIFAESNRELREGTTLTLDPAVGSPAAPKPRELSSLEQQLALKDTFVKIAGSSLPPSSETDRALFDLGRARFGDFFTADNAETANRSVTEAFVETLTTDSQFRAEMRAVVRQGSINPDVIAAIETLSSQPQLARLLQISSPTPGLDAPAGP